MKQGIRAHDINAKGLTNICEVAKKSGIEYLQLVLEKSIDGFKFGNFTTEYAESLKEELSNCKLAILGSYINPSNPDDMALQADIEKFKEKIRYASVLEPIAVGTETGTYIEGRTDTEEAYQRVLNTIKEVVLEAEKYDVNIAIEGVHCFVINTPQKMKRLLDDIDSDNLKVIYDPINYLNISNYQNQDSIIIDTFDLLSDRICVLHAKDFVVKNGKLRTVEPRCGLLNYDLIFRKMKEHNLDIPVICEEFDEEKAVIAFEKLEKCGGTKMEIRNASNPRDVKNYDTDRLREEFHISKLFTKDNIRMVYSHIDRIITAGIMPVYQELKLEGGKELASDYFLERREMGCINVGGKGIITVDGTEYEMNPRDGIYIGMGNKEIKFKSVDAEEPAKFYVSSCPAHATYPIVKIDITKAKKVPCGSVEDCNKRVINQYIHPEVIKSCQLAMGLTQLEPGSNWNTMPSHTHDRRMEVYMYLDMGENDAVFHMMGEPNETRHIIMHNEEAVISPSWSIHSGVGTKNYSFIWAMCGENQEFTDMDHIETKDLR